MEAEGEEPLQCDHGLQETRKAQGYEYPNGNYPRPEKGLENFRNRHNCHIKPPEYQTSRDQERKFEGFVKLGLNRRSDNQRGKKDDK